MPWWRRVCPPECQRYVTLWSRSLWLWYHLTIERSLLFFDVSIMCLLLKRKFVDYSSSESEMKTEILAVRVVSFNPLIPTLKLQSNGHYTAMRWLVHWPLMGWLLHLVQWGRAWAGCGPIQSPPRYTKCNGTHQRPVYQSPYCCPLISDFNVPIKGRVNYMITQRQSTGYYFDCVCL